MVYGMAWQLAWSNPFPRGHATFGNGVGMNVARQRGNYDGNTFARSSMIFWGSERALYEQSYENHFLNSIFNFTDAESIAAIYEYYAKGGDDVVSKQSFVSDVGPIQEGYGKYENVLDPSTVGKQFFGIGGLSYPGPANPTTYGGRPDYSTAIKRIEELPAIIHDKVYDKLKVEGIWGALTSRKAIGADWKFVKTEFEIALTSPNARTKISATAFGFAIGLLATPKTLAELFLP